MRIQIDSAKVAATFARFKDNGSFQESRGTICGGLPIVEMLQAMAMNEPVLQAFAGFDAIYPHGGLERSIQEKIILRVSQLHECQFCVNSHLDMMRSLDISDDLHSAGKLSERERIAIEYAELVTRDANRIPSEFFARLREVFNDAEIVELTFLTGLITMLNRFNNALEIRYQGELSGSPAATTPV